MNKAKPYIIVFFFLICRASKAQYYDDDAAIWLKTQVKKNCNKTEWLFSMQFRLNNNVMQLGQVAGELGFRYKFNKHFKVMLHYVNRFNLSPEGYYVPTHQFYTGFLYRQEFERFSLRYRFRVQTRVKAGEQAADVLIPKSALRNKLSLYYDLNKRIKIYLAYELISPLNELEIYGYNRSRASVGMEYKLNKRSTIEPYFMIQRRYTYSGQPHRDFVYGLNYLFSF